MRRGAASALVLLTCACPAPRPDPDAGADAGAPDAGPCVRVLREGSFTAVALADFDGDGRPEAAVGAAGELLVLRRDASVAAMLPVQRPLAVAAADLDGDGRVDLMSAQPTGLSVWLGAPGVTFSPPREYATPGNAVAAADFDGDGRLDVSVVDLASSSLTVLPGLGDGGLGAGTSYPTGLSSAAQAVGDFDRDGRPDVAVVGFDAFDVRILLARDGGLAEAGAYETDAWPLSIASADLDGDGDLDLAVTGSATARLTLLWGDGRGGFTKGFVPLQAPARPIVAGPRLAVGHWAMPGTIEVLSDLDGGARLISAGVRPAALAAGDLDGDGQLDLVIADDSDGGALLLRGGCGFMP